MIGQTCMETWLSRSEKKTSLLIITVPDKKTNGTTTSSSTSSLSSTTFQAKTRPLINTKSSTCTTFTSTCHKVITTSRPITSSNVTLKSLPTIVQSKKLPSKPNHLPSSNNLVRTASSPSLHKISTGKTIHRSHSKVELKGKSVFKFVHFPPYSVEKRHSLEKREIHCHVNFFPSNQFIVNFSIKTLI